jgi:CRP/FNR family cyclic AMP-dependent transcriptional regulator
LRAALRRPTIAGECVLRETLLYMTDASLPKSTDLTTFIESSVWRVGLTDAQIARVHRDAFLRNYSAGATVCARGSPSVHWLGVLQGMLKVDTVSVEGRSTTFAGVPSGAWFGEGAVLKGEPRPYSVVAISDSTVAFLPRGTFQWLLDESRPFSRWVIDQLNARLGHYIALIETVRFEEAAGRVAYCLAEMFNPQLFPTTQAQLQISQDEMAKLSGLSRQNTNRALHDLEQAGLVRMRYGVIEVLDIRGLQAYAHQH